MRRIAWAAAVVFALVAAFVMLRHRDDRAERDLRRSARLPAFDDRRVTGIVLDTQAATWRLVRRAGGWRIVAPVDDAADPRAVERLIGAAGAAPILRSIAKPDALATYGLAPPVARLTLEGVTAPTLELGSVAPTGDAMFARLAGGPEVLLLGLPAAQPLANVDPKALRDRSIVDLARSEIVGVAIAPSGLQLARSADGWWITAPRRFPASAAALDEVLSALYDATVVGWEDDHTDAVTRYGLGPDAPRITLSAPSRSQTVALGASIEAGERCVASEGRGTILIVRSMPPLDAIPLDLARLRERHLTNVNRYDVTRLVYASGGTTLTATRKNDATWTTESGRTIPAERVYSLLVALLEAETLSWTEGTLKGPPSATLAYERERGGDSGTVQLAGDRASWDALPGIVFRLASSIPPVPVATP
jgi:hypothetical protein